MERLAVREHEQVRDGRDDDHGDPLRFGRSAAAQQESHRDQQAQVDEEQRRVPHPDERDQHESRQQAAQHAAERVRKERVAGLGADPVDILRVDANPEREQDPHEHGRDERYGERECHAETQLAYRCGAREQDRQVLELPE